LQDYHSDSTLLKQGMVEAQVCVLGVLVVLGYFACGSTGLRALPLSVQMKLFRRAE